MHTAFLQQTIKLAVKSTQIHKGGPFAAIICRDQNIIATGINNVTCNNDPTAHAEIMAIRNGLLSIKHFSVKRLRAIQ